MSPRPRRKRMKPPEEHPDERWMASYMDMVTVLMCMFIVLFAMSSVDQEKFEQLKSSLATGFGVTETVFVDSSDGLVVPEERVGEDGERLTDLELALAERSNLEAIMKQIDANLAARDKQAAVGYTIDQRGLTVKLVSSETFFQPNKADLTPEAITIMEAITPVIAPTDYQVSIEGYADVLRPVDPYPTNWELSSGRATKVLRAMVENGGMRADHISSVGFGDARPVSAGNAEADLAANRRVDIVVLSQEPDQVRALIPGAVEQSGTAAPPSAGH